MDKFVTVATFQYPHEAQIIKSKLESQEIAVFLKDELTVQAHNFLSNAVGGIKLQIKESDINAALPFLKAAGLIEDTNEESLGYLNWVDKRTNKIPVVRNWPVKIRSITISAILIFLILAIYFISQLPSKEERLITQQKLQKEQASNQLKNIHLPFIDSLLYKEPQYAIRYSKKLLKTTYPKNEDLYSLIAYGYVEMDSFELASRYFNSSMAYGFRHPRGLSAMAYCEVQLKNYDKAIDHLKEAVELNEDYKAQLAEAYGLKEDWKNAEKYYSEYISDREEWDISANRNSEFRKLKIKRDSIKRLIH